MSGNNNRFSLCACRRPFISEIQSGRDQSELGGKVKMHGCSHIRRLLAISLVCLVLVTGCSWTDKHGTHHLIVGVGFGLVTTTNRAGVDVYDSAVLGAAVGPDGAGVGWMRHHRVQIDPKLASNVVISIKSTPGNLTITNYAPFWGTNAVQKDSVERKTNQ